MAVTRGRRVIGRVIQSVDRPERPRRAGRCEPAVLGPDCKESGGAHGRLTTDAGCAETHSVHI